MTEPEIKDINRFCWRRVRKFAGLYGPALRNQIIIYTLIQALLVIITSVFPKEEVILGACCIIWLMSISVPFVFIVHDDTIIRLAPVKASERFSFYLLWTLLIFPVYTSITQWIFMYVGSLFEPEGMLNFIINGFVKALEVFNSTPAILVYIASSLCGIGLFILVLDSAVTCRKHPILTAILRLAIVFVGISFLGIITGIVYATYDLPLTATSATNMIVWVQGVCGIFCFLIGVWALRHLYKYLK